MINAESGSREDAEKIENLLSQQVLEKAIEVHRTPGGLKSIRKFTGI